MLVLIYMEENEKLAKQTEKEKNVDPRRSRTEHYHQSQGGREFPLGCGQ